MRTILDPVVGGPDLILLHWPSCVGGGGGCTPVATTDPLCIFGLSTYNDTACFITSYASLVDNALNTGVARAVGVSNFNVSQLEALEAAGLPRPAVNQVPYSIYNNASGGAILEYCRAHNIVFNSYSPFGVPDRRTYTPPQAPSELQDPVAVAIAQAHGKDVSQVLLAAAVQQGMVINPRTMNAAHMLLNLGDLSSGWLTEEEMAALKSRPQ